VKLVKNILQYKIYNSYNKLCFEIEFVAQKFYQNKLLHIKTYFL